MKSLRIARICVQLLFFASTAAFFLAVGKSGFADFSHRLQIITLLLAETAGVAVVWCVITVLWGRLYCSTVCPVGFILDSFIFLRKKTHLRKSFRFSRAPRFRYIVLGLYIVLLLCGLSGAALLVDPWSLTGNIAGIGGSVPARAVWSAYGIGIALGTGIGLLSLLILSFCGLFFGRDYCNSICPLGLALGLISTRSVFNIVIEPDKCSGCLKCEEVCKASCIKVVSRYVDNTRCVRCFDCIGACPDKAITFRAGAPTASTPLFRRTTQPKV